MTGAFGRRGEWPDSADDADSRGLTIAFVALALALTVVAAAMLAPGLAVGPSLDAAVFDHVGGRLLQGVAPYVGAWDHKTPGIYLVAAAAQAILGWLGSWNAEWVLSVAVSAGIGLAVAATLARLNVIGWARSLAAMGSTMFSAHYLLALGGGLTEPPAALLAGSALILAIRPTPLGRIGIGLLVGLSVLISVQLLPAAFVVFGLAVAQLPDRERLGGGIRMGLASVVPLGVVALWLFGIGAMPAALDAVVTYSSAYRSSGNGSVLTLSSSVAAWTLLVSMFLVAPALLGMLPRTGRFRQRRATVRALITWIAASLVFVVLQGRFYAHYAIGLAVPVGILAGLGLERLVESLRRARTPSRRATMVVPLVAAAVVSVIAGVVSAALQIALVTDGSARMDAVSVRLRGVPAGPLLVWGNEPYLYRLADRSPATRYSYLYPLTTPGYSTQHQVDGVLRTLEANPPAVVVDVGSTAPGQPGFLPLLIDRPIAREGRELDLLDPLRAFVAAHYRLDGIVSGWPIYVLRNPEP